MRILLTGRKGQVGSELERLLGALGELTATDRSTLDLADNDAIRSAVRRLKPGLIVNAAAYNAVDKAESEREAAMQINANVPALLAEEAQRLGAMVVHYSTDYVFDGRKAAPYTEDDPTGPLSHYGLTKLEGERAIASSGCRHLTLRTSWVYGPRAANFYQVIRRKALAGEAMRFVDDQTSVPTPSAFLAQKTVELITRQAQGLLHLVPAGKASRYDFALEVVRATGSKSKVTPARTAEFPTPARRPVHSVLDNRRVAGMLGPLADWREVLAQTLP